MIQGVIKSMPDNAMYYWAGVGIPREGREFIVDEKTLSESGADAKKLFEERKASGDVNPQNPEQPVIFHVVEKGPIDGRDRSVKKTGKLVNIPGRPLVLDPVAYEHLRQEFGTHLHCEPIGGAMDAMHVHEKISSLEAENAKLKAKIAELESKPKK